MQPFFENAFLTFRKKLNVRLLQMAEKVSPTPIFYSTIPRPPPHVILLDNLKVRLLLVLLAFLCFHVLNIFVRRVQQATKTFKQRQIINRQKKEQKAEAESAEAELQRENERILLKRVMNLDQETWRIAEKQIEEGRWDEVQEMLLNIPSGDWGMVKKDEGKGDDDLVHEGLDDSDEDEEDDSGEGEEAYIKV